jgi:hypothetical protein
MSIEGGEAFLRTYGRCFAEFLNEESPVRLGLLDLPTCFGFSTDTNNLILEVFLERRLGKIDPPVDESFFTFWISRILLQVSPGFTKETSLTQKREFNNTLYLLIFVTPSKLLVANEY